MFTKSKCDLSDFCLAKITSSSKGKTILSNETIFLSLLHEKAGVLDQFEICAGGDFVTSTSMNRGSTSTLMIESPRLPKFDNGKHPTLEDILNSPKEDFTIVDTLNDDIN